MTSKKDDGAGSTLSDLLEILSHTHRRRILMAVAHHNPRDEDDIPPEAVADEHEDDDALERVNLEFQHMHLPKLADAGFIEWDRESGTITRGPRFEEIEPLLKLMDDHRDELPEDWP